MENADPTTPGEWKLDYDEFERMQREYRRQWWLWAAGCAATTGAIALFDGITGGILAILSGIVLVIVLREYTQRLSRHYKARIVPQLVAHFCDEGSYRPNEGIDEATFNASNLFSVTPYNYATEDLVKGRIGQTQFRFAEVHAQEKRTVYTRRGVRTIWIDIFRGFFFVADFNKNFEGQTILVPNYLGSRWLAGRQRVTLENAMMMRKFLVCSTDQVEARYILTPGLMEGIMKLWKRYPQRLRVSFTGSCIMIACSIRENHYEAGIWRSANHYMSRDIKAVGELTALIEELRMNTRIWTKGDTFDKGLPPHEGDAGQTSRGMRRLR